MSTPILVFVLFYIGYAYSSSPCEKIRGQGFLENPYDCSMYVLCINGNTFPFSCGPRKVWDRNREKCVVKSELTVPDPCNHNADPSRSRIRFSKMDFIKPSRAKPYKRAPWRFSKPVCTPGSQRRFPHPTNCAQYYDCGSNKTEDWWGTNLRECRYPLLFNIRYSRCDHYSFVRCNRRDIPVDPCDYIANQCRTSNCPPCITRFGSCKGKPNGLHSFIRKRKPSRHFLVCKDQRVVFHGRCMSSSPGYRFIFHPVMHICLPLGDAYKYQ